MTQPQTVFTHRIFKTLKPLTGLFLLLTYSVPAHADGPLFLSDVTVLTEDPGVFLQDTDALETSWTIRIDSSSFNEGFQISWFTPQVIPPALPVEVPFRIESGSKTNPRRHRLPQRIY